MFRDTVGLFAHLWHGHSTRNWSRIFPVLGLLGGMLMAPAIVLAAGQWTAQITGNGFPVLGPFSTKEQAVQALAAAVVQRCASVGIPCPAASTALQPNGPSAMTPNGKTYNYFPIIPSTPTSYSCYVWGENPAPFNNQLTLGPGCYSDEASAVAAATSMPGCYTVPLPDGGTAVHTNVWVTPAGDWSSQLFEQSGISSQAEIVEGNSKVYDGYQQNPLLNNNCATTFTNSVLLWRTRGANCPENFSVPPDNGLAQPAPSTDTLCYGPLGGTVTSNNLLECPANAGPPTLMGDPCDVATGDFTQTEPDYSAAGLNFTRTYHSLTLGSGMGVGWTHNYASHLVLNFGVPVGLIRPDGHDDALIGTSTSGVYISLSGAAIHVQASGANWIATLKDGSREVYSGTGQLTQLVTPGGMITTLTYNGNNQLSSVSGPFGRAIQFSYTNNQLQTLIDSAGNSISYTYDTNNNLTSVTYQDGTTRTYLYANSTFPSNLTGIVDESSNQFLAVTYDPTTGAATSSQQAGGAQAVSIAYSANGAVATDALGATHTYTFTNDPNYAPRVTALSINTLTQTFAVPTGATDPQRRVTQTTDANGNITTYAFDANHMTSTIDAYGTTVARTTGFQYLSTTSALPTLITEPLRQTAYAYFPGTSTVQTKTITDVATGVARAWNYTYNSYGQILTIDGPRTDVSDVTTYTYYTCTTGNQCGQVNTIQNARGQITTFNTYNAHGQPLTVTDPNGVVMTLTYDLRQRIRSRQVGTETTSYTYYPTGQLQTVTLPDGSTITNTYDAAHRLTDIADGLGNHTHYTLDAMGNRTAENTYDPSSTLKRTHTSVINALNQIDQDVNAAGTAAVTTTYTYDNNGNPLSSDAPLSRNTTNLYDPLNRLKQITDPATGVTRLGYDANDQLTSVVDPRSLTTSYTRNGFGDVKTVSSPDTGSTNNTYDSGGNLKTTTDARGATATYSYDALNRVSQVAYSDQTINFSYDVGTNGVGHLTGASDANHSLSWAYDALGRVTGKGQTIGTVTKSVGYAYVNGDLTSLVTPSGQTVVYGYTNHRIISVSVNGTTILSGVTHDPFGPVTGWTWGNGTSASRAFDEDGKLTQLQSGGEAYAYSYDDAFRITGIANTAKSNLSWTYGYDNLDRLSSAHTSALSESWTYDANGNRLTQGGTYPMALVISPTSNQITSGSSAVFGSGTAFYDAAGNTTQLQGNTGSYNGAGRMSLANFNGATAQFIYNALGERIYKNASGSGVTLFMYDEGHHLIGEYGSSGNLIEETVWMGDTPVATLRPSGSAIAIYYVHTDHLNRPRKISVPGSNALVWRADLDPFEVFPADNVPGDGLNQNPSGLGNFVYNLGLPGQYFDPETTSVYNLHRDYAASLGRYLESDPIGLDGGSYSTYAYAGGNPLSNIDSSGLEVRYMCRPLDLTSKANHCFVYVTCPEEGWSDVYSLFPYNILGSTARKYDMRDNPASASAYNSVITPKSLANESVSCQRCQFEKAVRDRYNSFTSDDVFYSAPFGPNSNSFANGLLDLPSWGVSAPIVPSAPAQEFGWKLWGQPSNPSYVPGH
jgi:RHS repeat-associated protein